MAIYEYKCEECGDISEKQYPMSEVTLREECPQCHGTATRIISQSGFVLKGYGWASKELKEKQRRTERYHELGKKQAERYGADGGMRLKPNVNGEACDSWTEAALLAKEKGKDPTTYVSKALEGS